MNARTLLLWGDTEVGKTTLLASWLIGCLGDNAWFSAADSRMDPGYQALLRDWERVRRGMPTMSTMVPYKISLTTRAKERLVIQDIRGGDSVRADAELPIDRADAVLFVVDVDPHRVDEAFFAIEVAMANGLADVADCGVVFTKADQFLTDGNPAWDAASGWWRTVLPRLPRRHQEQLAFFGDRVWPVSAFGFRDGEPAVVWSEFGQFLPLDVTPRNVSRPFVHVLRTWGLL